MPTVSEALRQLIRERAQFLCEYCHTSETWQYVLFTVDHIIPTADGGSNAPDNLALACFHCNRKKSSHQSAYDSESDKNMPLFNPRRDSWSEHFIWSADALSILGQTASGRSTIELLQMNRQRIQAICAADVLAGRHPPGIDSILTDDINE